MKWALALAAVCAAAAVAAAAAGYGDYTGARMPQYHLDYEGRDAGRDVYPDKSPDAPVSLDYKYEEDSGKLDRYAVKAYDGIDKWQRSNSKRNKILEVEPEYNQDFDKLPSTEDRRQNTRSSREQLKNRAKFRRKKDDDNEAYNLNDKRRFEEEYFPSRDNAHKYTEKKHMTYNRHYEKNLNNLPYGKSTRRIGNRKPRDRSMERLLDDSSDAILAAEKVFENEDSDDDAISHITGLRRNEQREMRNTDPELDVTSKSSLKRLHNSYGDYDDYYDMKRVLNIRNKLPSILRRTKASDTTPRSTLVLENWFRRANIPDQPHSPPKYETPSIPSEITTATNSTKSTIPIETTTKGMSTSKTILKTSLTSSNHELSLAEKSRLSILKKAQRKESLKSGPVTTKPPVLMQVSRRMQTVVMVEPARSEIQRLQAREISDDSPGRVAKAKQLIRHKLLTNAKNIRDLTENWDDLVCEYIDVSLLSAAPPRVTGVPAPSALGVLLFYAVLVLAK